MNKPLKGKVALVTGAGKGIGLAIAKMLAAEEARLVINARTEAGLRKVRKDIRSTLAPKAEIEIFQANVAEPVRVKAMIEETIRCYGRLDILINNAGISPRFALLHELSVEELSNTIDTNLKGPMYAMKYALPYMVQQESGCIININSIAGKTAFPYSSAYCASKFGLAALTECVAAEQRAINNIRIVGIYPGEVDTPIWDSIEPEVKREPQHMLQAEDVAQAVRYVLMQSPNALVKDITLVPLRPKNH